MQTPTTDTATRLDPARATSLIDVLPGAVVVVNEAGEIRFRNTLAQDWLLDEPDLSAALAKTELLEPFDGWARELSRIVGGRETRCWEGAMQKAGDSQPVMVTIQGAPSPGVSAEETGEVVILIVERARAESIEHQLEISNRLASLGKLATRVAHELSNPLDGILRYVNLSLRLADEVPQGKLKSYLSESRTGLMRMVQIIGDLLEYSRSTDGAFDSVDINEVVEQAVRGRAVAADAAGVVVAVDFQSQDMPHVSGTRLYQVCCNLIKNAIDAMPSGGRLSVTTGLVDDDVIIRVTDTGVGLPENIDAVFEPFYTTKEPGRGSGLGLAICKDFIEDMHGTITATRDEEGGAVFTVRIPIDACHRGSALTAPSNDATP